MTSGIPTYSISRLLWTLSQRPPGFSLSTNSSMVETHNSHSKPGLQWIWFNSPWGWCLPWHPRQLLHGYLWWFGPCASSLLCLTCSRVGKLLISNFYHIWIVISLEKQASSGRGRGREGDRPSHDQWSLPKPLFSAGVEDQKSILDLNGEIIDTQGYKNPYRRLLPPSPWEQCFGKAKRFCVGQFSCLLKSS